MKRIKPDIIAEIYLYDADVKEKGTKPKNGFIPAKQYSCPIFFGEEAFDCRLLLDQLNKSISPGERVSNVPIKFLFYELVKPHLKRGNCFKLWEAGFFGDGEIIEVL